MRGRYGDRIRKKFPITAEVSLEEAKQMQLSDTGGFTCDLGEFKRGDTPEKFWILSATTTRVSARTWNAISTVGDEEEGSTVRIRAFRNVNDEFMRDYEKTKQQAQQW